MMLSKTSVDTFKLVLSLSSFRLLTYYLGVQKIWTVAAQGRGKGGWW